MTDPAHRPEHAAHREQEPAPDSEVRRPHRWDPVGGRIARMFGLDDLVALFEGR
jgi:hypothetical protein